MSFHLSLASGDATIHRHDALKGVAYLIEQAGSGVKTALDADGCEDRVWAEALFYLREQHAGLGHNHMDRPELYVACPFALDDCRQPIGEFESFVFDRGVVKV